MFLDVCGVELVDQVVEALDLAAEFVEVAVVQAVAVAVVVGIGIGDIGVGVGCRGGEGQRVEEEHGWENGLQEVHLS